MSILGPCFVNSLFHPCDECYTVFECLLWHDDLTALLANDTDIVLGKVEFYGFLLCQSIDTAALHEHIPDDEGSDYGVYADCQIFHDVISFVAGGYAAVFSN